MERISRNDFHHCCYQRFKNLTLDNQKYKILSILLHPFQLWAKVFKVAKVWFAQFKVFMDFWTEFPSMVSKTHLQKTKNKQEIYLIVI